MGADKIFASPGSITGSIGVVAGKFSIAGLLQKLQITVDSVQIGTNADLWSPVNGFTPAGRAKLEEFADRSYQDFMTKAAEGRNMPLEAIHDLAKGQVWTGEQAWDLGLVDGLGGWMEAEDNLYQALALKDGERIAYSVYPKPAEDIQGILSGLGGYLTGAQASVLQKAWQRVTTSPISIQARMWATPQ
jgi:protease-4